MRKGLKKGGAIALTATLLVSGVGQSGFTLPVADAATVKTSGYSYGENMYTDDYGFTYEYDEETKTCTLIRIQSSRGEFDWNQEQLAFPGEVDIDGVEYSVTGIDLSMGYLQYSRVKKLSLDWKIEYIGENTLETFPNLEELYLGPKVKYIGISSTNKTLYVGDSLFRRTKLKKIEVDMRNPYYSVSQDGTTLYSRNKTELMYVVPTVTTVNVPANVEKITTGFENVTNLIGINVDAGNKKYWSDYYGNLYNKEMTTLITVPRAVTETQIAYGIDTIGDGAFEDCSQLKSIVIPEGTTRIEDYAFGGCSSLTSLTIPKSVVEFGEDLFAVLVEDEEDVWADDRDIVNQLEKNMTCYVWKDSKAYEYFNSFKDSDGKTHQFSCQVSEPSQTLDYQTGIWGSVGHAYIKSGDAVGDLEIPSCTTFEDHENIKFTVEKIYDNSFANCTGLTGVTIPGTVQEIGKGVFQGCKGMVNLSLGTGVGKIGDRAFLGCSSLRKLSMPSSVKTLGASVFSDCESLRSATVSEGITKIPQDTFRGCRSLKDIKMSESVTEIGSYAFSECSSLSEIALPASLQGIRNYAFSNCTALTRLEFPDGLTDIGDGAFNACVNLQTVKVPATLKNVGNKVFSGCSNLATIDLSDCTDEHKEMLEKALKGVEEDCVLEGKSGSVADTVAKDMGLSFYDTDQKKGTKQENIVRDGNGILYELNEDGSCTVVGVDKENFQPSGEVSIVDSITYNGVTYPVTKIADNTFADCDEITKIKIPENVTEIDKDAFKDCDGLTKVEVAEGNYTFETNEKGNLVNSETKELLFVEDTSGAVTVEDGIAAIGDNAFAGKDELTEVTISNSVTEIGSGGFKDCTKLEKVVIPSSVEKIAEDAFAGCSEKLVIYGEEGSVAQQYAKEHGITFVVLQQGSTSGDTDVTASASPDNSPAPGTEEVPKNSAAPGTSESPSESVQPGSSSAPMETMQPENSSEPEKTKEPENSQQPSATKEPAKASAKAPKKGTVLTDSKTKLKYKVIKAGKKGGTVALIGTKNKKAKKVTITATVKLQKITYNVVKVDKKAFYNMKSLTTVVIGKNVTALGDNAYNGCKKLQSITVKGTKLKTVGKNALKGTGKKLKIKVPKKKVKAYTKLFKKKGNSKVTIKK